MSAIITFPGTRAVSQSTRMERGDTTFWRRKFQAFKQSQCKCCEGSGQVWIYIDEAPEPCPRCAVNCPTCNNERFVPACIGAHVDDWIPCPTCTPEPTNTVEPDFTDMTPVEF